MFVLVTAPTIEPISLSELKLHLRVDSGTFDGNLAIAQSLAYGSHAIQDNYTTHVGAAVDVLGKEAVVELHCGTNGATGTNDTRIEESDDNLTFTAWTGGAFTQVTTANDNTDYKKAYTGSKRYIRTASKVLLAACEFGTSILTNEATTAEDTWLTACIQAAREYVEDYTRRALLTQTWDYFLDAWPCFDYVKLPFGNLQNTAGVEPIIKYKGHDGTETTLTATTDYLVETNGDQQGRIVLPYGANWPSSSILYPSNPISIRFVCGWTAANLIPSKIKAAIKMICADLEENREAQVISQQSYQGNVTVDRLLASARLWW